MEERKLVDIEEVKDVLGDTINSEGDYRHALRLLNGLNSVTEQDIVKSILNKIRADIEDWQKDIHDNEQDAKKYDFVFEPIYENIDKYKTESEK